MSAPLWSLTDELCLLYEQIEEADGEVSPELAAMLDEASGSFESKVSNCIARIREWEADAKKADDEIKRLHTMKVARVNKAARLRAYVLECMRAAGKARVDTGVMGVARIQAPRVSVHVESVDALPEEYRRVSVSPDKTAIRKALDAGVDVPGAALVAGEPSLVIK